MLRKWDALPAFMKCDEVREYYQILEKKKLSLALKRAFDVAAAALLLFLLAVPMAVIAVMIKLDSPGPVFYRQKRVTAYGRKFKIHKFRTMAAHADKAGTAVTLAKDSRITKAGARLRNKRLDEIPQLFDVLKGDMSFVGTRPEVPEYVKKYTKEMRATLLLPAGITSETSIRYKDEAGLLGEAEEADRIYVEKVLPGKMRYNLESIRKFSLLEEAATILRTMLAVAGKKEEENR